MPATHRMRASPNRSGALHTTGAGWSATLELRYERRGERSVVTRSAHAGPLAVQKALYPEGEAVCQSVVLHPPAGIVGGDRLEVRASIGAGAHAQLLTPGAARWYRSAGTPATQRVVVAVEADARAEWLPQENIVFDGAMAQSELRVELAPGATWVGWEIFCLGRSCAGERFERGILRQRTEIVRGSVLQWLERGVVDSASRLVAAAPGLNGRSVFGTLLAAAERVPDALLSDCRQVHCEHGEVGVTRVPGVLAVRYLGQSAEAARDCFAAIWSIVRPVLIGRDALAPRLWST